MAENRHQSEEINNTLSLSILYGMGSYQVHSNFFDDLSMEP